ncbi:Gar1 protein RNA binding region protein [Entamoeba histolytica HM-3:IMSS]|uniref:H/ACA ribonucleoprotein complex subunit n=4 Tax=Entamoeba histolytica TaxID=5759 RepID=C4LZT0_ENTH1|nr:snoRNP protein gar1, putative [Entamoeba histolytica HM-1:IMSS]EAL49334.2 snoRNP protein gar1, putative [Entamoeba histolytica HM-1:IMSS]EMD46303.1 Gar1 RNA binding protein, putative [Entamoeba histolytica KU27]EMS15900.1 Gar1 protein RNA binding region protein [Entamoeba histolytica HM-3:IMSS]GAT94386.1 snornp protein gar1 putative [Entamoeba histolytica]|eukprot:XP_654725.2 snoRNP protein gar1, putative [Entamoeba histolytica HM-1:IMSS]
MSFRGGRGGNRGRGRASFGGRDQQPSGELVPYGKFLHAAETVMVFKATSTTQYPAFNAIVYNEKKAEVGKVGEVFGPLNDYYFSVVPVEGVKPDSYNVDDQIYLYTDKLFSVDRLKNPPAPVKRGGAKGGAKGGANNRGSRGGNRGGSRGGFNNRGARGGNKGSFGGNRGGFGGNKGPRNH